MKTFEDIKSLQTVITELKLQGKSTGFVPTMGHIHQGHLSLIEEAQKHVDIVICSIFVNPLQFGPDEDLDQYPRTLSQDKKLLEKMDVDYLFTPTPEMIYPQGAERHSFIEVPFLSKGFCSIDRPGHFRGVATIVNKLFNLVQPDISVFGNKDFQQLAVIKKMVKDFYIPVKIIGAKIKREKNGLAMSSRNYFLTEQEKNEACFLYEILKNTKKRILDGNRNYEQLEELALTELRQANFKPEYFSICTQEDLSPPTAEDTKLVILAASYYGKPRLIDNITLEL